MTLSFEKADDAGLRALYELYARPCESPFFTDVSGPPPLMRLERFIEYCTEDDSAMLLCLSGKETAGCAHFRDKQPGLELANFDTIFFNGYPAPGSDEARDFGACFRRACAEQRLSRVQLLALEREAAKISFLESIGFKKEGTLREHYFFGDKIHDLTMLGWTSDDRRQRLPAPEKTEAREEDVFARSAPAFAPLPPASPVLKKGIFSRRAGSSDAALLERWYGDPYIQENVEDEELSPEGLRAKVDALAVLDEFEDGACAFIIEFDGEPAALAHYMWIDWVSRTGELDYFLAPNANARPFLARLVLREIGRIAFEGFNLRKLYGFIYATNDLSLRLNAQFLETEAILKDYLPGADVHVQALLASDYTRKFSLKWRSARTKE